MPDLIIREARLEYLPIVKDCMMSLYQSDR